VNTGFGGQAVHVTRKGGADRRKDNRRHAGFGDLARHGPALQVLERDDNASGFSACTFWTNAATASLSSSGLVSWAIWTPMREPASAMARVYLARSPSTSYEVPGQPSQ